MDILTKAQKVLDNYDAKKFHDNLEKELKKRNIKKGIFCKKIGRAPVWFSRARKDIPKLETLIAIEQNFNFDILELVEIKEEEAETKEKIYSPVITCLDYSNRLKSLVQQYSGNLDYKKYAKAVGIPWEQFKKYKEGIFPTIEDLLQICVFSKRSPFWLMWGIEQKYYQMRTEKIFEISNKKISLGEILAITEEILLSKSDASIYLLNCILTFWQHFKEPIKEPITKKNKKAVNL